MTARLCALVSVVAVVHDQKANRALTTLNLQQNNVADVGATALAEALKAPVCRFISSCSRHVLFMTTDVTSQCGMKSWRRQVVVQFVCSPSVFFFCLEGNTLRCVGCCAHVVSKLMWPAAQSRIGSIRVADVALAGWRCATPSRHQD